MKNFANIITINPYLTFPHATCRKRNVSWLVKILRHLKNMAVEHEKWFLERCFVDLFHIVGKKLLEQLLSSSNR